MQVIHDMHMHFGIHIQQQLSYLQTLILTCVVIFRAPRFATQLTIFKNAYIKYCKIQYTNHGSFHRKYGWERLTKATWNTQIVHKQISRIKTYPEYNFRCNLMLFSPLHLHSTIFFYFVCKTFKPAGEFEYNFICKNELFPTTFLV